MVALIDQDSSGQVAAPDADSEEVAQKNQEDDAKLLREALDHFRVAELAETQMRRDYQEDVEFCGGKQWPDNIQSERALDGRPCLVINRMPQQIQQVTNDQRQNRPAIKVHPIDDNGDPETADALGGIVRHIEYKSNADIAYDTGFESAVRGGLGYWRVLTAYVDPMSFDQELQIKRIRDTLSVFYDPYSSEPDGSDANRAFIVETLDPEEYKAMHPGSKLSAMHEWDAIGLQMPDWISKDHCRVAEYFYREWAQKDIALLSDGRTMLKEQLAADPRILHPAGGVTVKKERRTLVPTVKWCQFNGIEVLKRTIWLGKWIPIIPMYGNEIFLNGKRTLEGLTRNAKDAQRMYNYWTSAETETIALAPRAPFVMAEGQDEGHEDMWSSANRRNHSRLIYKPKSLDGSPLPPPQRNMFEPAVQAITNARMLAGDDIKATTGIYDAALGNRSNETSGIAIQRRASQTQTANFHFVDNLTRSIRHTGRILVDLIPKIYDTPRSLRIIGAEGDQKIIQVNQKFREGGKDKMFKLDVGEYDVAVDVGPSYATKRQEAVASMLDLAKSMPILNQIAPDLIVKGMDWPGSPEVAARLRKALPPGVADDPKEQDQTVPPQVKAMMDQQGKMMDALTSELHDKSRMIENRTVETESKERIEFKKLEVQLEIERAKLDQQSSLAIFDAELARINQRLDLLDINEPIEGNPDSGGQPMAAPPAGPAPQDMGQQPPTGGAYPPG